MVLRPVFEQWCGLSVLRCSQTTAVLVCAAACAAVSAGCGGGNDLIDLSPPMIEERLDMEDAIGWIEENSSRWRTLSADCDVIIRSRLIRTQGNQVVFRGGRLAIRKPGQIYLVVPATGPARLRMVGAFDLTELFADKVQTQVQGPLWSTVYSLTRATEPEPRVLIANAVTVDRQNGRILTYMRYNQGERGAQDGSLRVESRMAGYQRLAGAGLAPADIPTSVWIGYGGASMMIRLRNVRLNVQLDDELFRVRP